jgi:hypothetical protein
MGPPTGSEFFVIGSAKGSCGTGMREKEREREGEGERERDRQKEERETRDRQKEERERERKTMNELPALQRWVHGQDQNSS